MGLKFLADLNDDYQKEIWEVLCEIDDEFVPPLSARESSSQSNLNDNQQSEIMEPVSYFKELKKQQFIIALSEEEEVQGFMSFKHRYSCQELAEIGVSNYITTIGVKEKFRKQGLAQKMYDYIENLLPKEYQLNYITTRTWSTNNIHINILEQRGYAKVNVLKDHRGQGIDTIYFAKKVF